MSQFPTLVPSARLYVPGDVPQSRMQSLSGIDASFRRGDRRIGQALQLVYNNLTEVELIELQQHYIDQQGSFGQFFLSAAVWSGFTTRLPVPLTSDYVWRYSAPLAISHASCGRFNVEVQLVTEPIETGDVVVDGGPADPLDPLRINIMHGLSAAATPARELIINAGGAS